MTDEEERHRTRARLRRVDGTLVLLWLLVGIPVAYHYRHALVCIVALMLYQIIVGHWNGWATNR